MLQLKSGRRAQSGLLMFVAVLSFAPCVSAQKNPRDLVEAVLGIRREALAASIATDVHVFLTAEVPIESAHFAVRLFLLDRVQPRIPETDDVAQSRKTAIYKELASCENEARKYMKRPFPHSVRFVAQHEVAVVPIEGEIPTVRLLSGASESIQEVRQQSLLGPGPIEAAASAREASLRRTLKLNGPLVESILERFGTAQPLTDASEASVRRFYELHPIRLAIAVEWRDEAGDKLKKYVSTKTTVRRFELRDRAWNAGPEQ